MKILNRNLDYVVNRQWSNGGEQLIQFGQDSKDIVSRVLDSTEPHGLITFLKKIEMLIPSAKNRMTKLHS